MYKLAEKKLPKRAMPRVGYAKTQQDANTYSNAFKPLKISLQFHNYTGDDICIIDRSGMKFTVKPAPSRATNFGAGIMVVKNYAFHDSVIIDELILSNGESKEKETLLAAFRNRRSTSMNETAVDLTFTLDPDTFRELDECVYISELDVVITRGNVQNVLHPYSEAGVLHYTAPLDLEAFSSGLGFKWISHSFQAETMYVNISGQVIAMTSVNLPEMAEGVYVYVKGGDLPGVRMQRLTVAEAVIQYHFTTSSIEAEKAYSIEEKLANDLDFIRNRQRLELIEKEQKLAEIKIDATEETVNAKLAEVSRKHELEQATHAQDIERKATEHRNAMEKLQREAEKAREDVLYYQRKLQQEEESNRRKDYWDERSSVRKDSSELVKWMPTLLVGGGLLITKLLG